VSLGEGDTVVHGGNWTARDLIVRCKDSLGGNVEQGILRTSVLSTRISGVGMGTTAR
jgi:hypothetical protein